MSNDDDELLDAMQQAIENRVRGQLARHQRVSATTSWRQVVDIQISQEQEKLEKLADKWDEEERDGADSLRELAADWLPYIAARLRESN